MNAQPAVIVVGAGGHAVVVAEALLCAGRTVIGFVDEDRATHGHTLLGLPVLGGDDCLLDYRDRGVSLANGLGGSGAPAAMERGLRSRVQRRLQETGWHFERVVHPSAVVSPHARLDEAVQVLAGAVVQPAARIGAGAIVNTRAVVEHHCSVGEFAHVATGALLCGNVDVGAHSHVGAGAVLRQGVRIAERVIVGAGAVVLHDVSHGVVAGVPARPLGGRP